MPSTSGLKNFDSPQWFLFILFISISIGIPVFQLKTFELYLTDIVFILLFPMALLQYRFGGKRLKLNRVDAGVMIFIFFISISILLHPAAVNWSILGLLRVTGFYITARLILNNCGQRTRQTMHLSAKWCILLTVITGLLGLIIFILFDWSNPFVLVRDYYYGLVPIQLSGLDGHPNGAAQILFVGLLIFVFTGTFIKKLYQPLIWLAIIGLILTQAKSGLLYFAVAIWIYTAGNDSFRLYRLFARFASVSLIFVYLLVSHFFPVKNNISASEKNILPAYLDTSKVIHQTSDYTIYNTHYTTNKIAAWQCFRSHPWTGIGSRAYLPYIDSLQQVGEYPLSCRFKNPHCTYTGMLAKFGWIGFLGLSVLILVLVNALMKLKASGISLLFSSLFVVLLFDAFTSDLEYHKLIWFCIAWLADYASAEFH